MRDIVDIVEEKIVDQMNLSLKVKEVDGQFITVCSVKWARVGKILTGSDGEEYIIANVDQDHKKITLNSPFTSPKTTVNIERPLYFHGTPVVMNQEWKAKDHLEFNKVPGIWLLEPVEEQAQDTQSAVERRSELRVLFFDSRDGVNWTNGDIHAERSLLLYSMVDEFIRTIEREPLFGRYSNYSVRNLTKLGREDQTGFVKNIIDSDLTALDLRLTLPIYKTSNCDC